MTEREAIEAIINRWHTTWPALQPGVPSKFDNELGESEVAWCRVSIQHTTSRQMTMGSAPYRRWERLGNVFVQIFSPVNTGRGPLADLVEDARAVLEGQSLAGGVYLHAGRTEEQPTDGMWAMIALVVPFRYVSTR